MRRALLMRRSALVIALGLALVFCLVAQESATKSEGQNGQTSTEENPMTGWKWANYLILAVGLGYLIGKNVPPLFRKQSDEIHAALEEAMTLAKTGDADYLPGWCGPHGYAAEPAKGNTSDKKRKGTGQIF